MPRRPAFKTGPRHAPIVRRVAPRPGPRRVFALRGGIRREEGTVLFGGARRRRAVKALLASLVIAAGAVAVALAQDEPPQPEQPPPQQQEPPAAVTPGPTATAEPTVEGDPDPPIAYRDSRALGLPYANGRLRRGVQLPPEGRDFFTYDPALRRSPNRGWRRWGTDRLIRTVLEVLREHRAAHPEAPRVGIGDLSRPQGGEFGRRFGGLGHASHQNGLDVDIYYPRFDGLERRPHSPDLVDDELAQDLVDRFVLAGAVKVFVGPRLDLRGPRRVVIKLAYHDDHLHVRLPAE
jgi:murein endopeptidase